MSTETVAKDLKNIITPELCLSVYRLKWPESKKCASGLIGIKHFTAEYAQDFYDLAYHQSLIPLSKYPLQDLLAFDWTTLLPNPAAVDYPEQALGLVTLLDQQRVLTTGYGRRWSVAFFDPIAEKLARQLSHLPSHLRPDGKEAWVSRGYSENDWLVQTLWFWVPLVHSDTFMVNNRQLLKDYLHQIRAEAESLSGHEDPFAHSEAQDDVDVTLFPKLASEGPPRKSYFDQSQDATVADYTFWWIRILNAHFALTDLCGHYPYWIRYRGGTWNELDKRVLETTNGYRYSADDEPLLEQIRQDHLDGVWQPLQANPGFERSRG